jgi:ferredoxin
MVTPVFDEERVMRAHVDLNVCQGHGVCHMSAPQVFELDEQDGHAIVMLDPVPSDLEADAQLGADSCPERAIMIQRVVSVE